MGFDESLNNYEDLQYQIHMIRDLSTSPYRSQVKLVGSNGCL